MAKTGLLNNLFNSTYQRFKTYQIVEQSSEKDDDRKSLIKIHEDLKAIHASSDINTILSAEEFLLAEELDRYSNSQEETNSINKALEQIDYAKKSLAAVRENAEAYKKITNDTFSEKNKEGGLPIDNFRGFIKSHITRLTNKMTASLSVPEKNIIRQRVKNLALMKELYIQLQRKALGLKDPEKDVSKGMEL